MLASDAWHLRGFHSWRLLLAFVAGQLATIARDADEAAGNDGTGDKEMEFVTSDKSMVSCWKHSPQGAVGCCMPRSQGARLGCWDSIFTQKECCGMGTARVFPVADAELPSWKDAARWRERAEDAGRRKEAAIEHPSFSAQQRQWEVSMTNASIMMSAEVLGHRLRLWVFKRSGPALGMALEDLAKDFYRLKNLAVPAAGAVSVDVGSSVGMVAILLSRLWPSTPVIAIEPAPANFRYLLWNLRINGVASRVWPLNVAMGSSPSRSQVFYYSPTYPTWSQAGDGSEGNVEDFWRGGYADWQVRFEVEIVTLAELFVALGVKLVHFLKVDCEGCEWEILAPPSWPRLRHRVQNVAAELHRWALPTSSQQRERDLPEQESLEDAVRRDVCNYERQDTSNTENSICSTA